MLTRRLKLPYSVGLVVAGILLAVLPFAPNIQLTKDLIFTALLPPLLFHAAYYIDWNQLRRDFSVVVVLAALGVIFSATVTAAGMHFLAKWQWMSALVFGALIAATDPVSVIATFKEAKAHGRLLVLIEAESLFNDGTAAVAFGIVVALASGQHLTSLGIFAMLAKTIMGGILCGALVALAALLLAGRTDDHLVEITVTTGCRLWVLSVSGSFWFVWRPRNDHRRTCHGQFQGAQDDFRAGKGSRSSFLGICRICREFSSVSLDWNERGSSEFLCNMDSSHSRYRFGDARPGDGYLSLLPTVFAFLTSCHWEASTRSVLGRIARSLGAGAGTWASAYHSATRRDHYDQFFRRCLFCVRPRSDHGPIPAQNGRDLVIAIMAWRGAMRWG
jgi:hypothetical protein